jgi:hypothetical protein
LSNSGAAISHQEDGTVNVVLNYSAINPGTGVVDAADITLFFHPSNSATEMNNEMKIQFIEQKPYLKVENLADIIMLGGVQQD